MNARSIKFSLCSLGIHCALFWLIGQEVMEHGVARGMKSMMPERPMLTARLVVDEKSVTPMPVHALAGTNPAAAPVSPVEIKKIRNSSLAERVPETASPNTGNYSAVGRLTRLPEPVVDIDLNVAGINDIADAGKIEMTILVNEAGIVIDVIPVIGSESARAFVERVAQRFKSTRFTPGEINGKAVKSQVRITVVSENFPVSMSDEQNTPVM